MNKIDNFSQEVIEDYISIVENNLKFFTLHLDDKVDISMVFETMNFRGKTLSGLERFKNRVLYLLSNIKKINNETKEKQRKEINDTWLEVYKWLGKSREKSFSDDAFLKAFWIIQFAHSNMIDSDFKEYQKQIFEKDFKDVESNHIGMNMKWLEKMRKAIALWYFIHYPYKVEDDKDFTYEYTQIIQRSLYRITHFPKGYGRYMQTLILAILMRMLPTNERNKELTDENEKQTSLTRIEELLWCIERHNIICFLLSGNRTNFNREKTFRDSSAFYREKELGADELKNKICYDRIEHFDWEKVKRHIGSGEWEGKSFILGEYEESLTNKRLDKQPTIKPVYPTEEYHSIRDSYKDINRLYKINRDFYANSLGNLLITNGSNKIQTFEDIKKDIERIIRNETNRTTRFLYESEKEILDYSDWTTETISERSIKLFNFILNKWKIEKPKDSIYTELFRHT